MVQSDLNRRYTPAETRNEMTRREQLESRPRLREFTARLLENVRAEVAHGSSVMRIAHLFGLHPKDAEAAVKRVK